MKRRIVPHPTGATVLSSTGRGGPAPGPGGVLGPAIPVNPITPGGPAANASGSAASQAAQAVANQLGSAFQQAAQSILAPGQVLIGVVLVAAGLLLATGQMGKILRAGRFVATRGAVR